MTRGKDTMANKLVDTFPKYNDFGISKMIADIERPLKVIQKQNIYSSLSNNYLNSKLYSMTSVIEKMQKELSSLNKFNNLFNDNFIKEIQKILSIYNINSILPQFNDAFENLKLIHNNNYKISKNNLFINTDALINSIKLNNILDGCSEDDIENISNEFKNTLIEVNESLINQKKVDISNWQIKLVNKFKELYKENPIIIGFFIKILFPVIIGVMIAILSHNILLNIYSKPDNKSTVIYQTNIYQTNIIITNDIPYYYHIETKDKNGNIIKGYVSKRKYNKLKSNTNDNSKSNLNK